jgi:hypothetical protein
MPVQPVSIRDDGNDGDGGGGTMTNLLDMIAAARKEAKRNPSLAVYMVRDYQEVRESNLNDLAWSMSKGDTAVSEAEWFLDELVRCIAEAQPVSMAAMTGGGAC